MALFCYRALPLLIFLRIVMLASPITFIHDVTERFLRYVVIDTQSDPASPTCPSTEKQKNLGRLLASELQAMGLKDAHLDEHGYVYATIPANTDKKVPVICFCSHMDTSPDCTGANVKPQIVRNYRGGDIVLPADPTQVIRAADHPALADQIGHDIITTDGTTVTIEGVSTHPGFAKGKMEHAIKIAAAIADRLPKNTCSPETTEGQEGFLHPVGISGALEKATIGFIVRDFTDDGLKEKEAVLKSSVR